MSKRAYLVIAALLLCLCVQRCKAMNEVVEVTHESQARSGVQFHLEANQMDSAAVLVRMEIPRNGKLKDLKSVTLRIGSGRPIVDAVLQPKPGPGNSWIVVFQVSPSMADLAWVDLQVPGEPMTGLIYAVQLKGYVTQKKPVAAR